MGAAILDLKSWGPPSWIGSDVIYPIVAPILLFVSARSESPGEVMCTCMLVGAFGTRGCDKNHHLVC